jgi:hypothetical protein
MELHRNQSEQIMAEPMKLDQNHPNQRVSIVHSYSALGPLYIHIYEYMHCRPSHLLAI